MCGIAGIFDLHSRLPVRGAELEAMVSTMPHRGPDAVGVRVFDPRTGLGHVRLAILDLRPESNQPFEIDGGEFTITYNGEVYNYVEIRAELETLGHRFETRSDTEVILRAYKHWGPSALSRFNGMWAFAIYDRGRDELFCSRDRFGVKPFNYVLDGGRFIFASEIKAILAVAPHLAKPEYDSLSRLLRTSTGAQCEATCFENVKRLRPAHTMTVSRSGIRIERYWDFPEEPEDAPSYADAANGLRELLVDAVRLRMRSDVPVGMTLSGGLDSSSIACALRESFDGPLETFTAAFTGEPEDESPRARELSTALGMTPNLVAAEPKDFLQTLRAIVWHLESPESSPAVFPLWNIARLARSKVTVLLEGQGADEILAGYKFNFFDAAVDNLRAGQVGQAVNEVRWAVRAMGAKDSLVLAARRVNPPYLHKAFRLSRGIERVFVGPLRNGAEDEEERKRANRPDGWLNRSLIDQIERNLVGLLHYGDAISMAHSLESRLPFLDYRLVEYSTRLPGRFKFRDGRGKAVLRQAMRGSVPDAILDSRTKLGFAVPIAKWFRERPDETIFPVLRSPECRSRGILSAAEVEKAMARHISGRVNLSANLYRWVLTELWFQEFVDRNSGARTPA